MTQQQHDNPAAFPSRKDEPCIGGGSYRNDRPGMDLRDWFAGQALGGMLASHELLGIYANNEAGRPMQRAMASDAYKLADAMLAARSAQVPA